MYNCMLSNTSDQVQDTETISGTKIWSASWCRCCLNKDHILTFLLKLIVAA